jgi:hypothetical protein
LPHLESIRKSAPKESLARGIAQVSKGVRNEQTVVLSRKVFLFWLFYFVLVFYLLFFCFFCCFFVLLLFCCCFVVVLLLFFVVFLFFCFLFFVFFLLTLSTDECREQLRTNLIDAELHRFAQNSHPSLRSIINAAQDNMRLDGMLVEIFFPFCDSKSKLGNKSTPIFLDMHGNNSGVIVILLYISALLSSVGFVGRLLDKRSSLTPSSKREIKPREVDKSKQVLFPPLDENLFSYFWFKKINKI